MACSVGSRRNQIPDFFTRPDSDIAKRSIGLVLFSGFGLPEVAIVLETFQSANALAQSDPAFAGQARYDVSLLSAAGGRIDSSSSVFVWTDCIESRRYADGFHTLFVSGGADARYVLRDERLICWLRREGQRSEAVVPIGEGCLLLQAAGLKQAGKRGDLALGSAGGMHYLADGGFAGTIDRALHNVLTLIEKDFGSEFARAAAARVMPHRQPTSFTARIRERASGQVSERIKASASWLEMNGERTVTMDEAALIAAMSERNFLRRFKMEMGVTPSDYLLYVRIDMCCRLLIETDLPVDKIARRCGLGSGGWLSRLFRKYLSTTPTEYRATRRRQS
jgi:transcriptional regulator GlxA family with amidase domain